MSEDANPDLVERLRDIARQRHITPREPFRIPLEKLTEWIAADKISALQAENDRLREALKPWAFGEAANIRFVFTDAPGSLCDSAFNGQIVGVISGPWKSFMDCPALDGAVKSAREALKASPPDETVIAPSLPPKELG